MKIGLVLSGGGARGIAHLGMIKALQEAGVRFDAISGVSAGAMVGAFIAAGYDPLEICEFVERTRIFNTFKLSLSRRSFLNIEKATQELLKYLPDNSFESLAIPLKVTATDIRKGKVKVFEKGPLIRPVLSSCSIPVIFEPIKIGSRLLVDGGVLDNLPIDPIKKQTDVLIGLHCNPIDSDFELTNWRSLLERTMMMTITNMAYTKKKKCKVFIEPPALSKYTAFSFNKARNIYQDGYEHAAREIDRGVLNSLK